MRFALAFVGGMVLVAGIGFGFGRSSSRTSVESGFNRTLDVLAPSLSAQAVTAADEQKLKAEVNAFMDQYWQLWSGGRIDDLVTRIYHPMGQLSNQGHASVAQLKANFPASRKALVDRGYDHSNMPKRNICILSPTVAVISGRGMRYLTDGKVMGEFGWTYTLLKGAEGWKMVSIYSHDPAKALTCSAN